jgi:hypothetical protein
LDTKATNTCLLPLTNPTIVPQTHDQASGRQNGKGGAEDIVGAVLGASASPGTATEREVSASLAEPHAEAADAVRRTPAKHADETGSKLAGALRWLWAAVTPTAAYFVGHAHRGLAGLTALLGEALLCFTEDVFFWWYRVRDGALSRATLRTYIDEQSPGRATG